MSGTTLAHVSQLNPRANSSGVVVLGYDPINDTFVTVLPGAFTGQQGPAGPTGPQGPPGIQGVPGSPGTNGKTILNGTGVPAAGLGTNGDFYYDTQNKLFYGPKANGAWPAGFSIVGPQGPAGAAGTGGGGMPTGGSDGQVLGWVGTTAAGAATWITPLAITQDRTPTAVINTPQALTFDAHNRRRVVVTALAALTLAASEMSKTVNGVAGWGMEFSVSNRHTAINTITFSGTGVTVLQPPTGTGTGGQVKIAASTASVPAKIAVDIYRVGGTDAAPLLNVEISGDVV